jgi:HK97 family phage prohead protease
MDLYVKSEGGYVKKELTRDEYLGWFKSNIDDEGNVTEDCLLYKDADLTVNTDKSVTFVMSDDSLDRDFERFNTAGWDLRTYKKNPVLLWSHNRDIPAIGLMEKTRVKDNRLIGNPVFDMDDALAVQVAGKVQKKILRAGSVGFFPSKIEFNDDEKDPCKLTYLKQELREFSICNVPANPNATVIDEPGKQGSPEALAEIKAWSLEKLHTPEQMNEIDDLRIESSVIPPAEYLKLREDVDEMMIEIETIKTMQMKMAETVVKEDRNYYAELLETKKPKPQGLKELLKQRRSV